MEGHSVSQWKSVGLTPTTDLAGYDDYVNNCRYNKALGMLVLDAALILSRNVDYADSTVRLFKLENVKPKTAVTLYRSILVSTWTSSSGHSARWIGCTVETDGSMRLRNLTLAGVSLFRLVAPMVPLDAWTAS